MTSLIRLVIADLGPPLRDLFHLRSEASGARALVMCSLFRVAAVAEMDRRHVSLREKAWPKWPQAAAKGGG